MIVSNVKLSDLQQATKEVGDIRMEVEDRSTSRTTRFKVKLFPIGDKRRAYTRTWNGGRRRVNGCSWIAFRDWFRALYSWAPNADCRGGFQFPFRYRNQQDFEWSHEDTGNVNIGSRALPLLASENEWSND